VERFGRAVAAISDRAQNDLRIGQRITDAVADGLGGGGCRQRAFEFIGSDEDAMWHG